MNIIPLAGQCLVRIDPVQRELASGIVLPETWEGHAKGEKKPAWTGRVVAIGAWRKLKNGLSVIPEFAVGQKVAINPYVGDTLGRDLGERLKLIDQTDVIAVFDEAPTTAL